MYFGHCEILIILADRPPGQSRTYRYKCEGHVPLSLSLSLSYRPPPTAASIGASFLKWEGPTCIGRHLRLLAWHIVTSFRKLLSSGFLYKVCTNTNAMCGCDVCPPEFLSEEVHRRADVFFTSLCVRQQLTVLQCCPQRS